MMNKVKKSITGAIKPTSLLPKTGGLMNKNRDFEDKNEESKDTQQSSRMSISGKRPVTSSQQPKPTPSRRSDSKESTKNAGSASHDK
jgi:hypothetical protein